MVGEVQEEGAWSSRASSEEQTASSDNRALRIKPSSLQSDIYPNSGAWEGQRP